MQKQLTKTRILGYLLLLAMVTSFVFSISYAKYTKQINGSASADIAIWGNDEKIANLDTAGLHPGETKTYEISITNKKNGSVSQVAQEYSISLETTNNLPLTYTIEAKDLVSGKGTYLTKKKFDLTSGKDEITGGNLPYTESITHTYTLTVEWPSNMNDAAYMDEVDSITLTIHAWQSSPQTTS